MAAPELIGAGESVVTVADRLGHTNASTVIQVYAHLLQGSEDNTRRAIDGAWHESSSFAGENSAGSQS